MVANACRISLKFYQRDAETVARELLGKILVVKHKDVSQRARIVETEAYLGEKDLGCHASKGRTKRTEVMFGEAGRSYVYLIYGMYNMFNIVTDKKGSAHAVLIRALEPISEGLDHTNGPGKLTRALGITRAHNNLSVLKAPIWLEHGTAPSTISVTPRIGIDYAQTWKDAPLRFFDADSRWVSRRKN